MLTDVTNPPGMEGSLNPTFSSNVQAVRIYKSTSPSEHGLKKKFRIEDLQRTI